jgi:hypothetical protein
LLSGNTWAVSPDGATVAITIGDSLVLQAIDGNTERRAERRVPGASAKWTVVGWIERGILISDDPVNSGTVFVVDPLTGRRDAWVEIKPTDPAGLMNLNLTSLVTTPDGRVYGYNWHRATSDLYVVEGWN